MILYDMLLIAVNYMFYRHAANTKNVWAFGLLSYDLTKNWTF